MLPSGRIDRRAGLRVFFREDRDMRRFSPLIIAVLLASFVAPGGIQKVARADQRCTPIAHVLDASQLPANGSANPNDKNPDSRYHDKAGVNCIPTYEMDFAGALGG